MATKKKIHIQPAAGVERLLYGKEDAAFALGLGMRTIEYMLANGRLRGRKVGARTLIPAADVKRLAEQIIRSGLPQGVACARTEA